MAPALAFLLSLAFTPLVRGIAVRWKICEKPNGRTSRDMAGKKVLRLCLCRLKVHPA